jgi:para-nitrobenzyl esterase
LFSRAIVQSTSGITRLSSPAFAERVGKDLAARLHISADRAAFAEIPTPTLLAAMEAQRGDLADWGDDARVMAPWAPVADGDLLPRDALGAIRGGRSRLIPLLTGSTRDELRLYLTPEGIAEVSAAELLARVSDLGFSEHDVSVYRENRRGASPGDLLAAIQTDWYFRRPAVRLSEARAAGGAEDTWVYRLARPLPVENDGYGAAHGVDVPFVFGTTNVGETHARIGATPSPAVGDLLHGLWCAFIRGDEPSWSRYELDRRVTGVLTDHAEAISDPDGIERSTWGSFR